MSDVKAHQNNPAFQYLISGIFTRLHKINGTIYYQVDIDHHGREYQTPIVYIL